MNQSAAQCNGIRAGRVVFRVQVQPIFAAFPVIIYGGGVELVRRIGGVDIIRQRFACIEGGKRAACKEQREADRGRSRQQGGKSILNRFAAQKREAQAAKRTNDRAGEREQKIGDYRALKGGVEEIPEQRKQTGFDAPVKPQRRADGCKNDDQKQCGHRPAIGNEKVRACGGKQSGSGQTDIERVERNAFLAERFFVGRRGIHTKVFLSCGG